VDVVREACEREAEFLDASDINLALRRAAGARQHVQLKTRRRTRQKILDGNHRTFGGVAHQFLKHDDRKVEMMIATGMVYADTGHDASHGGTFDIGMRIEETLSLSIRIPLTVELIRSCHLCVCKEH
jgi:hypothetical protein